MPKPKPDQKLEHVSKPAPKPKLKGKAEPTSGSPIWKKAFESWAKGDEDVYSPILEVLGKMDEKQTAALIKYAAKTIESTPATLYTLESSGFDPAKPRAPVTEEQFQVIRSALLLGDPIETEFSIFLLAACEPPAKSEHGAMLEPTERKFQLLMDPLVHVENEYAVQLLGFLSRGNEERTKLFSNAMIQRLDLLTSKKRNEDTDPLPEGDIIWAVDSLGESGNREAIPVLKKVHAKFVSEGDLDIVQHCLDALGRLGFKGGLGEPAKREQDLLVFLQKEDQIAAYELLEKNRDIKQIVFSGSKTLEALPNPQAWITINDPELAKEAVRLLSAKLGSKIQKFDNALSQSIGVRSKNLTEGHFKFYADEILDAVIQVSAMKELKEGPEFSALLSTAKYSNGIKLRFTRREKSDLSLGDKCGDCTAKGSVNFGNSVTWEINPAYNILRMSSGGSFIGKINIALGKIAGEEAIIIDALEFNPQAAEGKPLHDEAVKCFGETLDFLRQLAKKQGRSLFALTFSNSSGASSLLRSRGFHPVLVKGEGIRFLSPEEAGKNSQNIRPPGNEPMQIKLLIPSEDVSRILAKAGFRGNPRLFYQMLDTTQAIRSKEGKDLLDEKLPILEREVLNPAQIENPEIAKAMRERDFETAAKLIFAQEDLLAKVKGVFKISQNTKISPSFLVPRMKKIYAADAWEMENLNKTFMVDIENFVKL